MDKKCFVLSGGGTKGAYQAGVISQLEKQGVLPDIIYGTSVGALNASALAYNSTDTLIKVWTSLKSRSDVLKFNWKFPFLIGDGFLSMNRLRKNYIDKYVMGVPHFEVKVCRTNLLIGGAEYISNMNTKTSDFRDAVQDSCTIPLFMEPRSDYMDGGLRDVIPLVKAIDEGHKEIYVITCNPWSLNPDAITSIKKKIRFLRFYTYLQRSVDDVMNHDVKYNDLYISYLKTKDRSDISIKVYCPNYHISSTLEFSPEKIKKAIDHGLVSKHVELKDLFQ